MVPRDVFVPKGDHEQDLTSRAVVPVLPALPRGPAVQGDLVWARGMSEQPRRGVLLRSQRLGRLPARAAPRRPCGHSAAPTRPAAESSRLPTPPPPTPDRLALPAPAPAGRPVRPTHRPARQRPARSRFFAGRAGLPRAPV